MIRIILADDHEIVREGLKRIISPFNDISVIAEAHSISELMSTPHSIRCDVLILDISFTDGNSIALIRTFYEKYPNLKILILSTFPSDQYADICFKAGAHGYLSKECAADLLIDAIRTVSAGKRYGFNGTSDGEERESDVNRVKRLLSVREYEVFLMLSYGTSTNEIARSLTLSAKTVSTHQKRIFEKLSFSSRGDLIRFAVERGFLSPRPTNDGLR